MPSTAIPTILAGPKHLIQSMRDVCVVLNTLNRLPDTGLFGPDLKDTIQLASHIGEISEEYVAGINVYQSKLSKMISCIHSETWELNQSIIADAKALHRPSSLQYIVLAFVSRLGLYQPPDTLRSVILDRWLISQDLLKTAKCQLPTIRQTPNETSSIDHTKTLLPQNGRLRAMLQILVE